MRLRGLPGQALRPADHRPRDRNGHQRHCLTTYSPPCAVAKPSDGNAVGVIRLGSRGPTIPLGSTCRTLSEQPAESTPSPEATVLGAGTDHIHRHRSVKHLPEPNGFQTLARIGQACKRLSCNRLRFRVTLGGIRLMSNEKAKPAASQPASSSLSPRACGSSPDQRGSSAGYCRSPADRRQTSDASRRARRQPGGPP